MLVNNREQFSTIEIGIGYITHPVMATEIETTFNTLNGHIFDALIVDLSGEKSLRQLEDDLLNIKNEEYQVNQRLDNIDLKKDVQIDIKTLKDVPQNSFVFNALKCNGTLMKQLLENTNKVENPLVSNHFLLQYGTAGTIPFIDEERIEQIRRDIQQYNDLKSLLKRPESIFMIQKPFLYTQIAELPFYYTIRDLIQHTINDLSVEDKTEITNSLFNVMNEPPTVRIYDISNDIFPDSFENFTAYNEYMKNANIIGTSKNMGILTNPHIYNIQITSMADWIKHIRDECKKILDIQKTYVSQQIKNIFKPLTIEEIVDNEREKKQTGDVTDISNHVVEQSIMIYNELTKSESRGLYGMNMNRRMDESLQSYIQTLIREFDMKKIDTLYKSIIDNQKLLAGNTKASGYKVGGGFLDDIAKKKASETRKKLVEEQLKHIYSRSSRFSKRVDTNKNVIPLEKVDIIKDMPSNYVKGLTKLSPFDFKKKAKPDVSKDEPSNDTPPPSSGPSLSIPETGKNTGMNVISDEIQKKDEDIQELMKERDRIELKILQLQLSLKMDPDNSKLQKDLEEAKKKYDQLCTDLNLTVENIHEATKLIIDIDQKNFMNEIDSKYQSCDQQLNDLIRQYGEIMRQSDVIANEQNNVDTRNTFIQRLQEYNTLYNTLYNEITLNIDLCNNKISLTNIIYEEFLMKIQELRSKYEIELRSKLIDFNITQIFKKLTHIHFTDADEIARLQQEYAYYLQNLEDQLRESQQRLEESTQALHNAELRIFEHEHEKSQLIHNRLSLTIEKLRGKRKKTQNVDKINKLNLQLKEYMDEISRLQSLLEKSEREKKMTRLLKDEKEVLQEKLKNAHSKLAKKKQEFNELESQIIYVEEEEIKQSNVNKRMVSSSAPSTVNATRELEELRTMYKDLQQRFNEQEAVYVDQVQQIEKRTLATTEEKEGKLKELQRSHDEMVASFEHEKTNLLKSIHALQQNVIKIQSNKEETKTFVQIIKEERQAQIKQIQRLEAELSAMKSNKEQFIQTYGSNLPANTPLTDIGNAISAVIDNIKQNRDIKVGVIEKLNLQLQRMRKEHEFNETRVVQEYQLMLNKFNAITQQFEDQQQINNALKIENDATIIANQEQMEQNQSDMKKLQKEKDELFATYQKNMKNKNTLISIIDNRFLQKDEEIKQKQKEIEQIQKEQQEQIERIRIDHAKIIQQNQEEFNKLQEQVMEEHKKLSTQKNASIANIQRASLERMEELKTQYNENIEKSKQSIAAQTQQIKELQQKHSNIERHLQEQTRIYERNKQQKKDNINELRQSMNEEKERLEKEYQAKVKQLKEGDTVERQRIKEEKQRNINALQTEYDTKIETLQKQLKDDMQAFKTQELAKVTENVQAQIQELEKKQKNEIGLLSQQIAEKEQRINELNSQYKSKMDELTKQAQLMKQQMEKEQLDFNAKIEEINRNNEKLISQKEAEIGRIQEQKDGLIKEQKEKIELLSGQLEEITAKKALSNEEIERQKREIKDALEQINILQQIEHQKKEMEQQLQELQHRNRELETYNQGLSEENNRMKQSTSYALLGSLDSVFRENIKLNKKIEELNDENKQMEDVKKNLNSFLDAANQNVETMKTELDNLYQEMHTIKQTSLEKNTVIREKQKNIETLKTEIYNYQKIYKMLYAFYGNEKLNEESNTELSEAFNHFKHLIQTYMETQYNPIKQNLEKQISESEEQIEKKTKELNEYKDNIKQIAETNDIEGIKKKIAQIVALQNEINELRQTHNTKEQEYERINQQLQNELNEYKKSHIPVETHNKLVAELKNCLEQRQREEDAFLEASREGERQIFELKGKIQGLDNEIKLLKAQKGTNENKARISELENAIQQKNIDMEKIAAEYSAEMKKIQLLIQEKNTAMKDIELKIQQKNAEIRDVETRILEKNAEISTLKSSSAVTMTRLSLGQMYSHTNTEHPSSDNSPNTPTSFPNKTPRPKRDQDIFEKIKDSIMSDDMLTAKTICEEIHTLLKNISNRKMQSFSIKEEIESIYYNIYNDEIKKTIKEKEELIKKEFIYTKSLLIYLQNKIKNLLEKVNEGTNDMNKKKIYDKYYETVCCVYINIKKYTLTLPVKIDLPYSYQEYKVVLYKDYKFKQGHTTNFKIIVNNTPNTYIIFKEVDKPKIVKESEDKIASINENINFYPNMSDILTIIPFDESKIYNELPIQKTLSVLHTSSRIFKLGGSKHTQKKSKAILKKIKTVVHKKKQFGGNLETIQSYILGMETALGRRLTNEEKVIASIKSKYAPRAQPKYKDQLLAYYQSQKEIGTLKQQIYYRLSSIYNLLKNNYVDLRNEIMEILYQKNFESHNIQRYTLSISERMIQYMSEFFMSACIKYLKDKKSKVSLIQKQLITDILYAIQSDNYKQQIAFVEGAKQENRDVFLHALYENNTDMGVQCWNGYVSPNIIWAMDPNGMYEWRMSFTNDPTVPQPYRKYNVSHLISSREDVANRIDLWIHAMIQYKMTCMLYNVTTMPKVSEVETEWYGESNYGESNKDSTEGYGSIDEGAEEYDENALSEGTEDSGEEAESIASTSVPTYTSVPASVPASVSTTSVPTYAPASASTSASAPAYTSKSKPDNNIIIQFYNEMFDNGYDEIIDFDEKTPQIKNRIFNDIMNINASNFSSLRKALQLADFIFTYYSNLKTEEDKKTFSTDLNYNPLNANTIRDKINQIINSEINSVNDKDILFNLKALCEYFIDETNKEERNKARKIILDKLEKQKQQQPKPGTSKSSTSPQTINNVCPPIYIHNSCWMNSALTSVLIPLYNKLSQTSKNDFTGYIGTTNPVLRQYISNMFNSSDCNINPNKEQNVNTLQDTYRQVKGRDFYYPTAVFGNINNFVLPICKGGLTKNSEQNVGEIYISNNNRITYSRDTNDNIIITLPNNTTHRYTNNNGNFIVFNMNSIYGGTLGQNLKTFLSDKITLNHIPYRVVSYVTGTGSHFVSYVKINDQFYLVNDYPHTITLHGKINHTNLINGRLRINGNEVSHIIYMRDTLVDSDSGSYVGGVLPETGSEEEEEANTAPETGSEEEEEESVEPETNVEISKEEEKTTVIQNYFNFDNFKKDRIMYSFYLVRFENTHTWGLFEPYHSLYIEDVKSWLQWFANIPIFIIDPSTNREYNAKEKQTNWSITPDMRDFKGFIIPKERISKQNAHKYPLLIQYMQTIMLEGSLVTNPKLLEDMSVVERKTIRDDRLIQQNIKDWSSHVSKGVMNALNDWVTFSQNRQRYYVRKETEAESKAKLRKSKVFDEMKFNKDDGMFMNRFFDALQDWMKKRRAKQTGAFVTFVQNNFKYFYFIVQKDDINAYTQSLVYYLCIRGALHSQIQNDKTYIPYITKVTLPDVYIHLPWLPMEPDTKSNNDTELNTYNASGGAGGIHRAAYAQTFFGSEEKAKEMRTRISVWNDKSSEGIRKRTELFEKAFSGQSIHESIMKVTTGFKLPVVKQPSKIMEKLRQYKDATMKLMQTIHMPNMPSMPKIQIEWANLMKPLGKPMSHEEIAKHGKAIETFLEKIKPDFSKTPSLRKIWERIQYATQDLFKSMEIELKNVEFTVSTPVAVTATEKKSTSFLNRFKSKPKNNKSLEQMIENKQKELDQIEINLQNKSTPYETLITLEKRKSVLEKELEISMKKLRNEQLKPLQSKTSKGIFNVYRGNNIQNKKKSVTTPVTATVTATENNLINVNAQIKLYNEEIKTLNTDIKKLKEIPGAEGVKNKETRRKQLITLRNTLIKKQKTLYPTLKNTINRIETLKRNIETNPQNKNKKKEFNKLIKQYEDTFKMKYKTPNNYEYIHSNMKSIPVTASTDATKNKSVNIQTNKGIKQQKPKIINILSSKSIFEKSKNTKKIEGELVNIRKDILKLQTEINKTIKNRHTNRPDEIFTNINWNSENMNTIEKRIKGTSSIKDGKKKSQALTIMKKLREKNEKRNALEKELQKSIEPSLEIGERTSKEKKSIFGIFKKSSLKKMPTLKNTINKIELLKYEIEQNPQNQNKKREYDTLLEQYHSVFGHEYQTPSSYERSPQLIKAMNKQLLENKKQWNTIKNMIRDNVESLDKLLKTASTENPYGLKMDQPVWNYETLNQEFLRTLKEDVKEKETLFDIRTKINIEKLIENLEKNITKRDELFRKLDNKGINVSFIPEKTKMQQLKSTILGNKKPVAEEENEIKNLQRQFNTLSSKQKEGALITHFNKVNWNSETLENIQNRLSLSNAFGVNKKKSLQDILNKIKQRNEIKPEQHMLSIEQSDEEIEKQRVKDLKHAYKNVESKSISNVYRGNIPIKKNKKNGVFSIFKKSPPRTLQQDIRNIEQLRNYIATHPANNKTTIQKGVELKKLLEQYEMVYKQPYQLTSYKTPTKSPVVRSKKFLITNENEQESKKEANDAREKLRKTLTELQQQQRSQLTNAHKTFSNKNKKNLAELEELERQNASKPLVVAINTVVNPHKPVTAPASASQNNNPIDAKSEPSNTLSPSSKLELKKIEFEILNEKAHLNSLQTNINRLDRSISSLKIKNKLTIEDQEKMKKKEIQKSELMKQIQDRKTKIALLETKQISYNKFKPLFPSASSKQQQGGVPPELSLGQMDLPSFSMSDSMRLHLYSLRRSILDIKNQHGSYVYKESNTIEPGNETALFNDPLMKLLYKSIDTCISQNIIYLNDEVDTNGKHSSTVKNIPNIPVYFFTLTNEI
jgi:hypothetical protein